MNKYKYILTFFFLLSVSTYASANQELVRIVNIQPSFISAVISTESRSGDDYMVVMRELTTPAAAPNLKSKYSVTASATTEDPTTKTGEGNFIIYKNGSPDGIQVGGLKPDTYYSIDIYKKDKNQYLLYSNVEFTTLAEKPEKQTQKIMWSDQSATNMRIFAKGGSGERVLVAVSKSQNDFVPVSGITFAASDEFGKGQEVANGIYIVLSENDSNKSVYIKNLEPATYYYFTAFEFNGRGKSCNYITDMNALSNAVRIPTLIETPKLENLKMEGKDGIAANWKKVVGATTYEIEVALDKNFENIDENYGLVDVGNVANFVLEELPTKTEYFIRIRAVGNTGFSEYSKVLSIKL